MEYSIVLLLSFLALCLVIGFLHSKSVQTFEGYARSKGHFGSITIFFTIVASFIGGGSILGTISKAYHLVFFPLIALCGFVVQLALNSFLIPKYISKFKNAITIGDIFDLYYNKWVKKVITILWGLFSIGILSVQIKGMGEIFSFSTSLSLTQGILISGSALIAYCTFGGIRAVVYTDILQAIVMFIVFPAIVYFLVNNFISPDIMMQKISNAITNQPISWNKTALFSAFIGFIVGDALIPPIMQRVLMAKTPKQIKITYLFGAVSVFFFLLIATLIGIALSNIPFPEGIKDTTGLMLFAIPNWFKPFAALVTFAVVISSADSYLNATSIQFVKDFTGKSDVSMCRAITRTIGVIAVVTSIYVTSLFDMLLFAYKFWGPIVLVPLIALITGKPLTEHQLKISFILSATSVIIWWLSGLEKSTSISDVLVGTSISLVYFLYTRYFHNTSKKCSKIQNRVK